MTDVLKSYEKDIEGYRVARDVAGKALLAIFEGDLWSESKYKTFDDYCQERWLFKKSVAYHLLDVGRFVLALEDRSKASTPKPTEHQLRKLKAVRSANGSDWEKRADAWEAISDKHGADLEPDDLKEILIQEKYVPPRAKRHEISAAERKSKESKALLGEIEDALAVLAKCRKSIAYFREEFGDLCLAQLDKAREWINDESI